MKGIKYAGIILGLLLILAVLGGMLLYQMGFPRQPETDYPFPDTGTWFCEELGITLDLDRGIAYVKEGEDTVNCSYLRERGSCRVSIDCYEFENPRYDFGHTFFSGDFLSIDGDVFYMEAHKTVYTFRRVIAEIAHYQIVEQDGLYRYEIFNRDGILAKSEENLMTPPQIEWVDPAMIRVTFQGGTGLGTLSGFYYDVENDRMSDVYPCILDQQGELLAYATANSIVVKSIFDDGSFYRELTDFASPFSEVAFPFVSAVFVEKGTGICVTYLAGENYEEVSEIMEIGLPE